METRNAAKAIASRNAAAVGADVVAGAIAPSSHLDATEIETSARPSTSDEHDFHELESDAEMRDEADITSVDFTEVDFTATDLTASEEQYGIERISDGIHPALEPIHADADGSDDHDDSGLSDFDDNHSGKTSVRDIMTWKEAIGMIIDGNMQMRAQSPQSSQHHPRGQRGGRGRGRGGRSGGGNRR